MLSRMKHRNELLLFTVMVVAGLILPAGAKAQVAPSSPSTIGGTSSFSGGNTFSGGNSFGGGTTGYTGGGLSGLSGGTGGLSGGMTGFSGGTQNNGGFRGGFWGQMPNNATGYQGGAGGGAYGGASGASTGPNSAFGKYYSNPQAPGAPNVSGTPNFYAPIYGGGTAGFQGSGSYGSLIGNLGGPGSSGYPSGTSPSAGSNNYGAGARRTPIYVAPTGFGYRPAGPSVTATEVEQILARSTGLNPNRAIRVTVDGPAVVLRGTVASEHDRRLAEAMIRLSPGVYEVRNELQAPQSAPLAGPAP